MEESILVYDPVGPSQKEAKQLRRPLDGLAGKVVGFIDNAKPNFDYLVDELAELLVRKYGVANIIKRRKRVANVPAPDTLIAELAEECDAVITGSGD